MRERALGALAVLTATALPSTACGGERCGPASAVVSRVVDGDTIELDDGEKLRYLMIDTPEDTTTVECYGPEATAYNRELVEGKTVDLAYDQDCTDRYDRLLAYVSVDGHEVNSLLVERGYACVLYIPPDGSDRADEFDALQAEARAAGKGLWGACQDIPCN
jgi:micrococcal nuclease